MAPSHSTKASSARQSKGRHDTYSKSASSGPGVQKLKSSIRQTKRLLAKDRLAADARVEAERRLQSLETDLAVAEKNNKERTFAVRYHKVKFFERQKVCRKIHQTKRSLEDPSATTSDIIDLQKKLKEHRLDLNYILHFPKTQKYVSLFPSGQSEGEPNQESTETDGKRHKIREHIRAGMDRGELDAEPEQTMNKGNKEDGWDIEVEEDYGAEPSADAERGTTTNRTATRHGSKRDLGTASGSSRTKIKEDDFFDQEDSN